MYVINSGYDFGNFSFHAGSVYLLDLFSGERVDSLAVAGVQVVEHHHVITPFDQQIDDVTANIPSAACDKVGLHSDLG